MQIADNTRIGLGGRLAESGARFDDLDWDRLRVASGVFVRDVLIPFAITRLVLAIVAIVSAASLPRSSFIPSYWIRPGVLPLLDSFARWDGLHYMDIAQFGYRATDTGGVAFFPLYPFLMRTATALTTTVTGPHLEVAGIVISNVCLLIAGALLVALARLDLDHRTASRAAWYLFLFPTSLFLSAIYAESLFLALSLGALLAARRGHWLLAGVLAALGAITRPFGFVLALPLAVEAYLQWRAGGRDWRSIAGIFAAPAAFIGHMAFLWRLRGDPLVFLHVEKDWHRSVTMPWQTFIDFFAKPLTVNSGLHSAVDLGFAVFTIAIAIASWKMLRPSYALYLTALTLIPLSSGTLGSIMRFDLVYFPIFLVLAKLGRSPVADRTFTALGFGAGAVLMAMFAQWYWVA